MRLLLSVSLALSGVVVIAACRDGGGARTPTAPETKSATTPVPTGMPTPSLTPVATAVETPPVVASPTPEATAPPTPPAATPVPTPGREGERCLWASDCAGGLYCNHPVGACYGAGTCKVIPRVCWTSWEPVCGCDHITYGNSCEAAMAAVSIASTKECTAGAQ